MAMLGAGGDALSVGKNVINMAVNAISGSDALPVGENERK
jgi:hypothetical protein